MRSPLRQTGSTERHSLVSGTLASAVRAVRESLPLARDQIPHDHLVLYGAGAVKVAVRLSVRSISDTNGTAPLRNTRPDTMSPIRIDTT
jgi:hypothetical protein